MTISALEVYKKNGAKCHIHMAKIHPSEEELKAAYAAMPEILLRNLPRLDSNEWDIPIDEIL